MILPTLIAQSLGSFESQSPLTDGAETDPGASLETIMSNVIGFLTIIGALFFIVYFFIGALEWISSAGDSGKLSNARNRMIHGILGLIIIVAGYAIIGLLGDLIGIDILNPALLLEQITPGASS